MERKGILLVFTIVLCVAAQGQGLLKRVKAQAENIVVNKARQVVEKKIDDASTKKNSKKNPSDKSVITSEKVAAGSPTDTIPSGGQDDTRIQAYSKFDFVAGDELLIADDFSQDVIGEFPKLWNTNNKGEVVEIAGKKWLKLYQQSIYLTPNKKVWPENYTIEFDLILDMHKTGYLFPEVNFNLLNTGKLSPSDNAVFKSIKAKAVIINIIPAAGNTTKSLIRVYEKESESYKTSYKNLELLEKLYGKSMHVAISVQKERLRMWINEERVYDLPKIINGSFNQFALSLSESNYTEDQLAFYLSDLRIATGKPDTRNKLLTEGKFTTTGITFPVNSDIIQPVSFGIIKEIADALTSDENVKIRIIGHTDSDGSKKTNETLSAKRAAAVKNMLVSVHNIAADRILTEGKGAAEPVAPNTTTEGKARNRRVEFVKIK